MNRLIFLLFLSIASCNFYAGMFRKNDLLVAQDTLYKERSPFGRVMAKYGRLFKCSITYIRVVDRLGVGRGPNVQIIRGGLQRKNLVLRLTSLYHFPISVNIYVGCENKITTTTTTTSKPADTTALETTTGKVGETTDVTGSTGGATSGTEATTA